jgi:NTP pyrophosphatase (non-canonical NTP hydrolase)
VGEVSKEVLNATIYGREPFQPQEQWADELADVFFTPVCLSNGTGVDLEVALRGALEKYGERLATDEDAGSGR